jgi:hypothetical protein
MNRLLPILFVLCAQLSWGSHNTLNALSKVNQYWLQQSDLDINALGEAEATQHREWIKVHLKLVEQQLRARSTTHLSESQAQNRLKALDHLNAYWKQGAFPINNKLCVATPIFIDDYDNFCAVGYLVKATGFESISRMIAAKTNLAYVKEMNYPQLNQWALDYGFTTEELAWIQPQYYPFPPNPPRLINMGNGVNGIVDAMCADLQTGRIYFAGQFDALENGLSANNIAYFIKTGDTTFDFHNLGAGLVGEVAALAMFDGQLIAGGQFTASDTFPMNNAAVWNDTLWRQLGCLNGKVSDLVVFEDTLFAVGHFAICGGDTTKYGFAKWNGSNWEVFTEVEGKVNKIIAFDGNLVLGGKMRFDSENRKTLKWNPTNGFSIFSNDVPMEVTAFGLDGDLLYLGMSASLEDVASNDTIIRAKTELATLELGDSVWYIFFPVDSPGTFTPGFVSITGLEYLPEIKAIIEETASGVVYVGGHFQVTAATNQYTLGDLNSNSFGIDGGGSSVTMHNFFNTNNVVNCFVKLGDDYYMGGAFTVNGYKGLGKMFPQLPTSIPQKELLSTIKMFPNPAMGGKLHIELDFAATTYGIYDLQGKLLEQKPLNTKSAQIDLSAYNSGNYILYVIDEKGNSATKRFVVIK